VSAVAAKLKWKPWWWIEVEFAMKYTQKCFEKYTEIHGCAFFLPGTNNALSFKGLCWFLARYGFASIQTVENSKKMTNLVVSVI
jgi:hypothetical protein